MALAGEFRDWADKLDESDPRQTLARDVADALEDAGAAKLWSQLNLRDEFGARRRFNSGRSGWLQLLSGISYVLPVALAWWHLRSAFGAYADTVARAPSDVQINFLAFWTGAYDKESWARHTTSASTAALTILGCIVGLILVQVFANRVDESDEVEELGLNKLVTRASLEFAKNRAVTPEELSSGITAATKALGEGLANLRKAFDDTATLVSEVQGVTGTITESAQVLRAAADSLVETMKPLSNFGVSADSAANMLSSTVTAIDRARSALESGAKAGAESLSGAGRELASELDAHARVMKEVREAVGGVSSTVSAAASGLRGVLEGSERANSVMTNMVDGMNGLSEDIARAASSLSGVARTLMTANSTLADIAKTADDPAVQSYVVAVRNHAESMTNAARAVEDAVRHLSTELSGWGEGRA